MCIIYSCFFWFIPFVKRYIFFGLFRSLIFGFKIFFHSIFVIIFLIVFFYLFFHLFIFNIWFILKILVILIIFILFLLWCFIIKTFRCHNFIRVIIRWHYIFVVKLVFLWIIIFIFIIIKISWALASHQLLGRSRTILLIISFIVIIIWIIWFIIRLLIVIILFIFYLPFNIRL